MTFFYTVKNIRSFNVQVLEVYMNKLGIVNWICKYNVKLKYFYINIQFPMLYITVQYCTFSILYINFTPHLCIEFYVSVYGAKVKICNYEM